MDDVKDTVKALDELSNSISASLSSTMTTTDMPTFLVDEFATVTMIAKYNKERIILDGLPPTTTLGQVKEMIRERTRILPMRQKLVGLTAQKGGIKAVKDTLTLQELQIKPTPRKPSPFASAADAVSVFADDERTRTVTVSFILMGTPEEQIFVDRTQRDDLPDVVDDFDFDFNAGSTEWLQHVANENNLREFTEKTVVHLMNPIRPGKPLLVLDLDHTLLDFSSRQLQETASVNGDHVASTMKRPYMNEFLTRCYRHFDMVVWSQTSWRWLEMKLTELGMVTHPGYKFAFVLDKTSMFTVMSTRQDKSCVQHHVKPLQLIWTKYPHWGPHNSVHIDDLSRNFALNLGSGLKIKAYFRKKSLSSRDSELLGLAVFLEELAISGISFEKVNFDHWADVVSGKRRISDESYEKKNT